MQHCNIYYCLKEKDEKPDAYVRKLLEYGFEDSFSIPYREEEILRGECGKPLSVREGVCFNISHGHRMVALACAKVPVGIDVESPRKVLENAMKKSCSHKEWEWLLRSENRQEDFLRLWTLKESYVKMLGTGLRMDPAKVEVMGSDLEGFLLQYDLEEGYLSVCLDHTEKDWRKEDIYLKKMSFTV